METYNRYPLEWLDLLITITLNPSKTNVCSITYEQIREITIRLREEIYPLKILIKGQIFDANRESEINLIIKQYHSTFIILLNYTLKNQQLSLYQCSPKLKELYKILISALDELISFIETWFPKYLCLEERVPKTYLTASQNKIRKNTQILKDKARIYTHLKPTIDIVLNALYRFTTTSLPYETTFRAILYKKELVKSLEEMKWDTLDNEDYTALDELLIYLNFNSKAYMNLLTKKLAVQVNSCKTSIEKMNKLLLFFKSFKQFHRKPDRILNPNYHSLETVISNWFTQEIFYLEKKLHFSVIPLQGNSKTSNEKNQKSIEKQKVMCILSTDQTALILRATDELRILNAKSMSEVFRTIVPYLSTPYKEDLSYDSMRSKSYVAEGRDKEIAIETLEKIIKKIKEY